jgi:hypothetical protein
MRLIPIVAMIAAATIQPASAQVRRFALSTEPTSADTVAVASGRAYADGYGYEPGSNALFSVAAAPGNYRVTVTIGLPNLATETTIKAESRRLMIDALKVAAGRRVTVSFIVNVRDASSVPTAFTAAA